MFLRDLTSRLSKVPGVHDAGYSFMPLLGGGAWGMGFTVEGYRPPPGAFTGSLCNAVSPGYVETDLLAEYFARQPQQVHTEALARHVLGRLGTPADVAHVVTFLLSSRAAFVTGADWAVDGGLSARFA